MLHEQWLLRKTDGWRTGVPGALALLCLIVFATGVTSRDIRTALAEAVWGSLGGAALFGALYFYVRRSVRHRLRVLPGDAGVRVLVEGPSVREELGPGLVHRRGVFIEHVDAHVASRDVPVCWVQLCAADGRTLTVRRGLGIQHEVPRWPQGAPIESRQRTFSGDPEALAAALD